MTYNHVDAAAMESDPCKYLVLSQKTGNRISVSPTLWAAAFNCSAYDIGFFEGSCGCAPYVV